MLGSTLTETDDAAAQIWGGGWRMPDKQDWDDLWANCHSEWTDSYSGTGVKGLVFYATSATGPSYDYTKDAHIFVPAVGYGSGLSVASLPNKGYYWARGKNLGITSDNMGFDGTGRIQSTGQRRFGFPIRPVHD